MWCAVLWRCAQTNDHWSNFCCGRGKTGKDGVVNTGITVALSHNFSDYKILSFPRFNKYIWSFRIFSGQEDLVINIGCNMGARL